MMQAVGGRDASGDVRKLQAELRSLEELIMIFTDLNPAAPTSKQSVSLILLPLHFISNL